MTPPLELTALRDLRSRLAEVIGDLDRLLEPDATVPAHRQAAVADLDLDLTRLAALEEQLGDAARAAAASFAAALPRRVEQLADAVRAGDPARVGQRLAELRSAAGMFAAERLAAWAGEREAATLDIASIDQLHVVAARAAVALETWSLDAGTSSSSFAATPDTALTQE
ncbi:MAG: hypothetical protein H6513_17295 [Acidimicrobiaceae bacterium]|nr:hypothetical protein [Ilumatobacter sp.]MCB9382443.1 hypothetical protein [Acidimicrobiaceae bacterium]MCO5329751.1 hypothetical protein [Ilumatobacteraceae bacterium]